ncbi:4'-phosphopantetheinyl transferase superfamily protein [Arsenicicoccus piscis]|uniref:holo-ACP synthase n=1 Tax=Arsenicicoccus piscis TaxID=673954 RepID=UPI001F4CB5E5|nr:4'-phosphopantetheinyl transferase superfamily protein [Arsenicicoccus piscis]MCH8628048.1 4'-phosphopantetheinyl transferase superfamily protein [Arsenicicoccus piscis]
MGLRPALGGEVVLGIGIDTADTSDVAASLARFGRRYVDRVLAPSEAVALVGSPEPARLIAWHWAAKEAVTKTLAPVPDDSWPWPAIEVDRADGSVRLHGRPAELAAALGVERVTVATAGEALPAETCHTVTVLAVATRSTRSRDSSSRRHDPHDLHQTHAPHHPTLHTIQKGTPA